MLVERKVRIFCTLESQNNSGNGYPVVDDGINHAVVGNGGDNGQGAVIVTSMMRTRMLRGRR